MGHENLWAPWRMAYLRDMERKAGELRASSPGNFDAPADFFARYWNEPDGDEPNLVIHRDAHGIVLLNRYPYANGHLIAALGDRRPTLLEYEPDQRSAFWRLIEIAMQLMQHALNPQGINLGINQGAAAGAGVPGHLHAHLVPRWNADTNFITVVGEIRVIPDALERMAEEYREAARELRL